MTCTHVVHYSLCNIPGYALLYKRYCNFLLKKFPPDHLAKVSLRWYAVVTAAASCPAEENQRMLKNKDIHADGSKRSIYDKFAS